MYSTLGANNLVVHCICVWVSGAVTQREVTALSDRPPHGPFSPANITVQFDVRVYSRVAHRQTSHWYEQSCLSCWTGMSLCLQDECSVSSEEFDMSDPTWISAERHAALSDLNNPSSAKRMHSPQNAHKDEDGKRSACISFGWNACACLYGKNIFIWSYLSYLSRLRTLFEKQTLC